MTAVSDGPLSPVVAAELRRLVGEVLAEVLPALRSADSRASRSAMTARADPPAARPRLAAPPATVPSAGGVPSGVPAGLPPAGARHGGPGGAGPPAGARHGGLAGSAASAGTANGEVRQPGPAQGPGRSRSRSPARAGGPTPAEPATALAGADSWDVRISTDAELREFVLRVLRLADNPKLRRDLIAGRIRFRLAGPPADAAVRAAQRVEAGAVTERAVIAAAKDGARLVLGPRAVLTPLAKDKARTLGVPIEKER